MKITAITCFEVPLTSHATYYMAAGKTCDTTVSTIVRIETSDGLQGYGEVCPIPHYLPAYAGGVVPAVAELAPVLLGRDFTGPEAFHEELTTFLPGHVYAHSAIDIALWDLFGQIAQMPLYQMLGGRLADSLPLYHSITCIAPEAMAGMAKEAQALGMTQFQVKLGADANWRRDVERLLAVREAVGPGPLVYGDWNCGASRLDATRVGRAVRDDDIMLEQPCATLAECAAVRDATGLPMKIDENAHDTASMFEAYRLGCMDAVALKLSKFGGLTELKRARDLCYHMGAKMCIECTWGSDIVTAAALHLAAATRPEALLNTCDLADYVGPRVAPTAPTRKHGRITPPTGPGLGIEVDDAILGSPKAIFGGPS